MAVDVTAGMVKELRDRTGAGFADCRTALKEHDGDMGKAAEWLRQKGIASAEKKADRVASQGVIEPYVHGGRIGVLLELNCETDFVARTDDFKTLARTLAQQIVGANPKYVNRADVPEGAELGDNDILMEQVWIRDSGKKIQDLIKETIAKVGENVVVRRFTRYELGQ